MCLYDRDVKPHNVMLEVGEGGGEDTPVLMDFGSMGPARVEITSRAQAQALQVGSSHFFSIQLLHYKLCFHQAQHYTHYTPIVYVILTGDHHF